MWDTRVYQKLSMCTLTDLPHALLVIILEKCIRAARISLFQTCRTLHSHPAFHCFARRFWVWTPPSRLRRERRGFHWERGDSSWAGQDVYSFCAWPRTLPLDHLIMAVDLSVKSEREDAFEFIEDLKSIQRAQQLCKGIQTLNLQGIVASPSHMGHVLDMAQTLLHLCPIAHTINLPSTPANHLHRLTMVVASHPAATDLHFISWQSVGSTTACTDGVAQSSNTAQLALPCTVPAALSTLTRLNNLDLTVLGCASGGVANIGKKLRAGKQVSQGEIVHREQAQGGGRVKVVVGLDLEPLSQLTALTKLALQAQGEGEGRGKTVVCTGLAALASRCRQLKRLEMRNRMLMAVGDVVEFGSIPIPELSLPLWPSLKEVLLEDPVTPAELVSLLLHSAPVLERIELLLGLELPPTPSLTDPLSIVPSSSPTQLLAASEHTITATHLAASMSTAPATTTVAATAIATISIVGSLADHHHHHHQQQQQQQHTTTSQHQPIDDIQSFNHQPSTVISNTSSSTTNSCQTAGTNLPPSQTRWLHLASLELAAQCLARCHATCLRLNHMHADTQHEELAPGAVMACLGWGGMLNEASDVLPMVPGAKPVPVSAGAVQAIPQQVVPTTAAASPATAQSQAAMTTVSASPSQPAGAELLAAIDSEVTLTCEPPPPSQAMLKMAALHPAIPTTALATADPPQAVQATSSAFTMAAASVQLLPSTGAAALPPPSAALVHRPLLAALAPLGRRLQQLSLSGGLIQQTEDVQAVASALPYLRRLAINSAAGLNVIRALIAAAFAPSSSGGLRRLLVKGQLKRIELCVGDGGKGIISELLRLCGALRGAVREDSGATCVDNVYGRGRMMGRVDEGFGEPMALLLVGCGRRGTAAVRACKAAWERDEGSGEQEDKACGSQRFILKVDELPNL